MRTATVYDLEHHLTQIRAWLQAGEDVHLLAEQTARSKPVEDVSTQALDRKVDWTKSAAFRDRTGEQMLSAEDVKELFDEVRGEY